MPFGDGTGPMGQGPMTGRGAGYCADRDRTGYANPRFGRRDLGGRWFGRGRGYRCWARAAGLFGWRRAGLGYPQTPPTAKEEKAMLEDEKEALQEDAKALRLELEEIEKRTKELDKSPQTK